MNEESVQHHLDAIENAMNQQMQAAQMDDLEAAANAAQDVTDALEQMKTLPPEALQSQHERISRIESLHRRIQTVLTAKKIECDHEQNNCTVKRRKMQRGKRAMDAYHP